MTNTKLQSLYEEYNYPGATKLFQIAKKQGLDIKYDDVMAFAKKQRISQIFKTQPAKRGFIVAFHPNERMQMDLIDMTKFSHNNGGYGWIMLIVDIFTRRCFAYAMKKKNEQSIYDVLTKFFDSYHPYILISDNESGFRSKIIQRLMDEERVDHQMVDSGDHKALGVIDRAVQTIKNAVYKYLKDKNTTKYINHLPTIISSYNATPNLGIQNISPNDAQEKENVDNLQILNHKKEKMNLKNRVQFAAGDTVRIRAKQTAFMRSFDEKYSDKVHTIEKISGQYAILNNGERVNTRRLMHDDDTNQNRTKEVLTEAKRESKIKKAIAREHLEIKNKEFQQPLKERRVKKIEKPSDIKNISDVDIRNIIQGKRKR